MLEKLRHKFHAVHIISYSFRRGGGGKLITPPTNPPPPPPTKYMFTPQKLYMFHIHLFKTQTDAVIAAISIGSYVFPLENFSQKEITSNDF